jgi:hypothetical protein
MECGLIALEFIHDLNVDEVRKGQLLALTFGLPLCCHHPTCSSDCAVTRAGATL